MSQTKPSDPVRQDELKNEQLENPAANEERILRAVLMLLSDLCLTRFELLMMTDQDPSEAAKEVIESLDRYDFLGELATSKTSYLEGKKQLESDVSNAAESVIREQNPR